MCPVSHRAGRLRAQGIAGAVAGAPRGSHAEGGPYGSRGCGIGAQGLNRGCNRAGATRSCPGW